MAADGKPYLSARHACARYVRPIGPRHACYTSAVGEILIGTSGYSYDDWVGPVYPEGTHRSEFLPFYARRFPFTELNFTYYQQPTGESLRSIATKTGPRFRFTVKAFRALTHDREAGWQREAERFVDAVRVLQSVAHPESEQSHVDQLIGILLQFPYSFHYTAENRRYLASVCDALAYVPLFVEYRNAEWDHSSVWREMERRGLGLVIPDLPQLDGLPRTPPRLTAPSGYIRFHGRNADNWWQGSNVTRYDYLYSDSELAEWIGPIGDLSAKSETLVIAFNNHFNGQAVVNAEQLRQMLA
jgi:uncharacterized protein YecE (DUF72 family)